MKIVARIVPLLLGFLLLAVLLGSRMAPESSPQDPSTEGSAANLLATKPSEHALERYAAAKQLMAHAALLEQQGRGWVGPDAGLQARVLWSQRLAKAALAVGQKKEVDAHVEYMTTILAQTKSLFAAGRRSGVDVAMCRYHLADAQLLAEQLASK